MLLFRRYLAFYYRSLPPIFCMTLFRAQFLAMSLLRLRLGNSRISCYLFFYGSEEEKEPTSLGVGVCTSGCAAGSNRVLAGGCFEMATQLIRLLVFIIFVIIEMDKPQRFRRMLTLKKIQDNLHQQQAAQQDKKFNPGQVDIPKHEGSSFKLVNFFGDLRTEVMALKVNASQSMVAAGCSNGETKVYDVMDGKLLKIGNTSRLSGYPTTGLSWKPIRADDFVACNCDGTIKWYNCNQQNAYGHYERNQISYLCCDYQAKEEWCVFGTDHNTIEIFDNQTMKIRQAYHTGSAEELNMDHHVSRIFSVRCLKKDPAVFYSGGWDSTVQIWDIRAPEGSVRKICGPSISGDSLDMKGNTLLVGNYQNTDIVQLYDFGKGELIETLDIEQPSKSTSYCLAASYAHCSEKDLIGIALSGTNTVKVLKDKKVAGVIKFQAAPFTLDFYQFNRKDFLIVGGAEGTIYCFKLDFSK